MVARHFLEEDELLEWLQKDSDFNETAGPKPRSAGTRPGLHPAEASPHPGVAEGAGCPDADDPDACNVYKVLTFSDEVYESISEYYEQKAEG